MSVYGVTAAGFVVKPLAIIKAELEADLRAPGAFGADVNLDPREPLGQIVGVMSDRLSQLWDLGQAVYRANDPDGAVGDALEAVAGITGTLRAPATKSTTTAVLAGTAATVVPATTSRASAPSTGAQFALRAAVTLTAVSAWAGSATVVAGNRRTNGGQVYEVVTGGVTAASGGPTGQGSDIVDNAVHWRWVGTGAAAADGIFDAVLTGPKQALAGALSQIDTPVSGWTSVHNVTDAVLGTDLQTDASLRVTREQGLRAVGSAAAEAIRSKVLNTVAGVTACSVFENTSGTTDADGVPAKAIEVLVSGGADQDIWDVLWRAAKAAGIETYGSSSGTSIDSQGVSHAVKFSRPGDLLVYLDVSFTIDATKFPVDGDAQVVAALAAKQYAAGDDVVSWQLKKLLSVSGVIDVPLLKIGLAASPTTETTIVVTSRQLAKLDSARIAVHHV